jgi:hypothetical protein
MENFIHYLAPYLLEKINLRAFLKIKKSLFFQDKSINGSYHRHLCILSKAILKFLIKIKMESHLQKIIKNTIKLYLHPVRWIMKTKKHLLLLNIASVDQKSNYNIHRKCEKENSLQDLLTWLTSVNYKKLSINSLATNVPKFIRKEPYQDR